MGLMVQASQNAAQELTDPRALSRIDGILVVKSLSTDYPAPAAQLAEKLGASPKFTYVSKIGGNSPQTLVNKGAAMIARGELDSVLVVGAEAYVQRGETIQNEESALLRGIPRDYTGDDASGTTGLENSYGIEHPMQGFPLFETALWAASGLDISTYLNQVGRMWAGFSQVAALHPHSWSKKIRTSEEIITPGPHNRPIAFPYTKFMNSFVTVDQGAAVILMSEEAAKKYQRPDQQTVFFLGGGYAEDRQRFMIERSDFTLSPPLEAAVQKALDRSGLSLSDMDCFDLYSCFPCAVSIARRMLNLSEEDPRPLTLTGGLGFFGGPGNNYNLHAIATLSEMIAHGKKKTGMVTALGWFMHKHAAGIYSSIPPTKPLATIDMDDQKNYLTGPPPLEIDEQPTGSGTIETYTVVHARDHSPAYAVLYGRTSKGKRFIARTLSHPDIFKQLSSQSMVGESVTFRFDPKQNMTIALFY